VGRRDARAVVRREPLVVAGVAAVGGLLLLLAEPGVGLVALAGVGAAVLLAPGPRRLVSGVLLLVGGVTVGAVLAGTGDRSLLPGAVLLSAAAGVAVVRSGRWPPPRRGERDRSAPEPTDRDTWAALDRGEDPTA
jgi:hypothetical protein